MLRIVFKQPAELSIRVDIGEPSEGIAKRSQINTGSSGQIDQMITRQQVGLVGCGQAR